MIVVAFVALAAAGTIGRWQLLRLNRPDYPLGTLVANVVVAFALGLLHGTDGDTRVIVGVALIGSLSTFSTVVGELVAGSTGRAAATNLGVTQVAGVAAAWLGLQLT